MCLLHSHWLVPFFVKKKEDNVEACFSFPGRWSNEQRRGAPKRLEISVSRRSFHAFWKACLVNERIINMQPPHLLLFSRQSIVKCDDPSKHISLDNHKASTAHTQDFSKSPRAHDIFAIQLPSHCQCLGQHSSDKQAVVFAQDKASAVIVRQQKHASESHYRTPSVARGAMRLFQVIGSL
ncbi:hypothetical protein VTO42DRAFT_5729 [Malbranchea cinnamomea]